jgi:hypothetical protein
MRSRRPADLLRGRRVQIAGDDGHRVQVVVWGPPGAKGANRPSNVGIPSFRFVGRSQIL